MPLETDPVRPARQHGAMEYSEPPVDLDAVRLERLGRIRAELTRRGLPAALFFDQINCRYATDATNMQIWCAHYEARAVFVAAEGPCILFDYADLPHLAEGLPTIDEYRPMPTFYYFTAGARAEERAGRFADQIADLMAAHGAGDRRLAVDRLSALGCAALARRGIKVVEGEAVAEQARAVKSAQELMLMRAAIAACEEACRAMYAAFEPGITENALWAKLHEANIRLGGEWIETRLLSAGPRTNPWFRECSMRAIEAREVMSFDTDLIGPYGYCADISRAWLCGGGEPSPEQADLMARAQDQIAHNISILKPGKSFREVSMEAFDVGEAFLSNRYPSLIHGVGLADEWPSIKHAQDFDAKGYDGVLVPGMTLCVESYIGREGGKEGVKLEEQVLITEDGVEVLSALPLGFEMG
ncbi:MAG: Xaa-Pro peptidase family protein [Marivibrio sp.]|uniref:M24 family metallopeptidase n=1 Tax=Marivibrio sp. TaxID=2039719 RepID=UPI0032ED6D48